MVIDKIALTLAIIGALNWGSVGLFGFDCVAFLFFFFNDTATTEIYTLSLHDALPILAVGGQRLKASLQLGRASL